MPVSGKLTYNIEVILVSEVSVETDDIFVSQVVVDS